LIEDLSLNQNFELIYEFIKTFGEHLETINIRITDKKSLKSNHYWLMAIIPKLKSLKNIRLIESDSVYFGEDGFKFLSKAFNYF
jgi:hypothetical protein